MLSFVCLYFLPFVNFAAPAETLPAYESFEHFDVGKYTTQYGRTFDEDGVLLQHNAYHPVTISIYGIMSYDAFMTTGDSTHYYNAIRQYAYFADSSRLVYADNNESVGLPYTEDYNDLKAPWFSGMAQGTAVSYLLRYYVLTKDKTALELSKKLMHLLLKSEQDGGTIGRTKEGGMWIEEYPGSRISKSVLNGFINGWIGVYEYCLMFPGDSKAAAVRDSCYTEMISNLYSYDTPAWTTYSRDGFPISSSYLRYQLEEFDHLYSLLGDVRLRNQMRIWSRMAVGQPDKELLFLKHPEYEFAMKLGGDAENDSCVFREPEKFAAGLVVDTAAYRKRQLVKYRFSDARYYCEIQVAGSDALSNQKITCSAYSDEKRTAVRCTYNGSLIIVESDAPFNALALRFPSQRYREQCAVVVKSYSYKACTLPLFAFTNVKHTAQLDRHTTCHFEFSGYNLANATVFYRYARPGMKIERQKFTLQQSFPLDGGSFQAPAKGTYEFFISYDLVHPRSAISKLKLRSL